MPTLPIKTDEATPSHWFCQLCGKQQDYTIPNIVPWKENPEIKIKICSECLKSYFVKEEEK